MSIQLKSFLFLIILGLGLFTSCSDDDETNTIVDIALDDAQFSTLVSALERVNLVATLQGPGPYTVFAPTNNAFTQLGVDLNTISDADLTNILLYHVLGGTVRSTDLADGQTYASTASTSGPGGTALSMLIEKSANGVKLNGNINVTGADVTADNGVIHIVDKVITPLDIVGHAAANSNFTSLVATLSGAPGGLVGVLSGTGPFTVFAPVNSAFSAISSVVATLTPAQVANVLTYHVVSGANVRSTDLSNGMSVQAVNGQSFQVNLANGASITDAGGNTSNILLTDVQATNGVIHVLEKVIIPSL